MSHCPEYLSSIENNTRMKSMLPINYLSDSHLGAPCFRDNRYAQNDFIFLRACQVDVWLPFRWRTGTLAAFQL